MTPKEIKSLKERAQDTGLSFDFYEAVKRDLMYKQQEREAKLGVFTRNPYQNQELRSQGFTPMPQPQVQQQSQESPLQIKDRDFFTRTPVAAKKFSLLKNRNFLEIGGNFAKDFGEMMIEGEKVVGEVLSSPFAMKNKDVQAFLTSRADLEANAIRLRRALFEAQQAGDTDRAERLQNHLYEAELMLGERGIASLDNVVPGATKTNWQLAAGLGETSIDLLTAGSYSRVKAGVKSFKVAKGLQTANKAKAIKLFNKEVPKFIDKTVKTLASPVVRSSAAYGTLGPMHEREAPTAAGVAFGAGAGTLMGLGLLGVGAAVSKTAKFFRKKPPVKPLEQPQLPFKEYELTKNQPELPLKPGAQPAPKPEIIPKEQLKMKFRKEVEPSQLVKGSKQAQIGSQTEKLSKTSQVNLFEQIGEPTALKSKKKAAEQILPSDSLLSIEPEVRTGQEKASRFGERLAGSENVDPELRHLLTKDQPKYIREHNIDTAMKAQRRVAESPAKAEAFLKQPGVSAEKTATGIELIKDLQSKGEHGKAAEIASYVSEELTKAGQAVQAARIYENLSPEAYLIRTQKFIEKQNKKAYFWQKQHVLTESDAQKIYKLAKKMSTIEESAAKIELAAELGGIMESYTRSSFLAKVSSAQVSAQLLTPKRAIRDFVSNELFHRLERLSKYIATPIDIARSKLTGGQRTVSFVKLKQGNLWESFMKGTRQYSKDFVIGAKAGWKGHSTHLSSKYDIPQRTFKSKANPLYWLERATGASVKAFDFASYSRKYNQVLYEQAWLKARNEGFKGKALEKKALGYLKELDIAVHALADAEGKYVTFQDDSLISKGAVAIKKVLNVGQTWGVGDLVLKYPRTPGNILARTLEYSPAGFVKAFREVALPLLKSTPVNNREVAHSIARAVVGTTGLTAFGAYLARKKIISGRFVGSWDEMKFASSQGVKEYQINLSAAKRWALNNFQGEPSIQEGDILYTYDFADPVGMSLGIGANLNQTSFDQFKGLVELFITGTEAVDDQLFEGVLQLFRGEPASNLLKILEGAPASFTPGFFNQLRQFLYNEKKMRDGKTSAEKMINQVKAKLPYFAEDLPVAYDTLGQSQKDYDKANVFNIFINPGNVSKYRESDAASLVLDLIASTGEDVTPKSYPAKVSLFGKNTQLSGEERSIMQQWTGQKALKLLDDLANSPEFMKADEEDQVNYIKKQLSEIGKQATLLLSAKALQEAKENDGELFDALVENKPSSLKWEDLVHARDYILETGLFAPGLERLFTEYEEDEQRESPFRLRDGKKQKETSTIKEATERFLSLDELKEGPQSFMSGTFLAGVGLAMATRGKKTKPLQKSLAKSAKAIEKGVSKLAKKIINPKKPSTKVLNSLEGKTTVSKQFISDLTKQKNITKVERELFERALETEGPKIDAEKFVQKVQDELLPLKTNFGDNEYKYVSFAATTKDTTAKYAERVYTSPYRNRSAHFPEKKYFGHIRYEDLPGGTRRIIEVQSDLYQGGGLSASTPTEVKVKVGDKSLYVTRNRKTDLGEDVMFTDLLKSKFPDDATNNSFYFGGVHVSSAKESIQFSYEEAAKAAKLAQEIADPGKLVQYNNPTAHYRLVREEIKQAAIDGKKELLFPDGKTAHFAQTAHRTGERGELYSLVNADGVDYVLTGLNEEEEAVYMLRSVFDSFKAKLEREIPGFVLPPGSSPVDYAYDAFGAEVAEKVHKKWLELGRKHEVVLPSTATPKVTAFYEPTPASKFYENSLSKYLKNNYNATKVSGPAGSEWFKVDITPELKNKPVEAFGLGLAALGADEEDGSRNKILIGAGLAIASRGKDTKSLQKTLAKSAKVIEKGAPKLAKKLIDPKKPTTKVLNSLEGKSIVSKQFISDLTKQKNITKVERKLFERALEGEVQKIDAEVFIKKVQNELLPLKTVDAGTSYRSTSLLLTPEEKANLQKYAEIIYESPVRTGTKQHYKNENYFAHVRYEDHNGGIRRILEVQSDFFQGEFQLSGDALNHSKAARLLDYNNPSAHYRIAREEIRRAATDGKSEVLFPGGRTASRIQSTAQMELDVPETTTINGVTYVSIGMDGRDFHPIVAEESVVYKYLDKLKKEFPKFKGEDNEDLLWDLSEYVFGRDKNLTSAWKAFTKESGVRLGEVSINKEVVKFYEKVGAYLEKNFGATKVKRADNEWFSVKITPEMKTKPTEAFGIGLAALSGDDDDNNKVLLGAAGLAIASQGRKSKPLQKALTKEAPALLKKTSKIAAKTPLKKASKEAKLLAVHTTSQESFKSIVKEGKIWGPSVAVFKKVDDAIPTETFGDFHFLINEKSINPKNKDVLVYSADAFSPRGITDEASLNKIKDVYLKQKGSRIVAAEFGEKPQAPHVSYIERIKSLEEMREKASKLTTSEFESMSTFRRAEKTKRKEIAKLMHSKFREDLVDRYGDDALETLQKYDDEVGSLVLNELAKKKDGLKKPGPLVTLMKNKYDTTITEKQATSFLDAINNAYNTIKWTYLEAKAFKGLSLSKDIDAVIVPNTVPKGELAELAKKGIKYATFDRTAKSFQKAAETVSKTAFSVGVLGFSNLLAERVHELKTRQIERPDLEMSSREVMVTRGLKKFDASDVSQVIKAYTVKDNKYAGPKHSIGNLDLETVPYASSKDHIDRIKVIYSSTKDYDIEGMKKDFQRLDSPLQYIIYELEIALEHYGITPGEFTAVVRQDSGAGTRGRAVATKNPGNILNTDDGKMTEFATWIEGSIACIRNLAERKTLKQD